MIFQRAYDLMGTEMECIQRNANSFCDRDCEKCDLVQDDKELLLAYTLARIALKRIIDDSRTLTCDYCKHNGLNWEEIPCKGCKDYSHFEPKEEEHD